MAGYKVDVPKRMRLLNKSGKMPEAGDIFTFSVREGEWMFGRAVRIAPLVGMFGDPSDHVLVYAYKDVSKDRLEIPRLSRENLLFPPMVVSARGCWGRGYFETVRHEPLDEEKDVLRPHCFVQNHLEGNPCVDEFLAPVKRQPLCGMTGLFNVFGFEGAVLRALGEKAEEY